MNANLISFIPGTNSGNSYTDPVITSPKICVSGEFVLDLSANFSGVEMVISSGSRLKKDSPTGHAFNNCIVIGQSGSEIIANPAGTALSYIFFGNSNITGLQKMSALNRGSFSFDANTTLSTIGSIEIKTNSTCGSFGAAFTNAPINIENSGAFIDFGSSDFVGLDAPNTFCIKAFNGGSFFGTNDDGQSNYSKGSDANIICDNCNPSSFVVGAKFSGGSGVRLNNSTGFMVDNCNFSNGQNSVKTSNSSNLIYTNCKSQSPWVTWDLYSNIGTNEKVTNNDFTSWAGIELYFSEGTNISNNPRLQRINSRFGNKIKIINNTTITGNVSLDETTEVEVRKNSMHFMRENLCMNTIYHCNNFNWGMSVEEMTLIDLRENFFNDVGGLTFDCSFNDQVDKGNKFFNGAEVIGKPGYSDGTFFVSNLANEHPAHTPDEIMENTGNSSFTCTQGIPPGSNNNGQICDANQLNYIKKLIIKLLKCRSDQEVSKGVSKGVCHKNMRIVNRLLKLCPNLKDDPILKALLNQSIPQEVYKLPEIHDLMVSLNTVRNTTSVTEIQEKMKNVTLDNMGDYHLLNEVISANQDRANESKEMRHNMINQFIGEYNEVQSEENSINKYKNALIWYLEYNRDLIASQNRKAEIKSLAEDCTEYDSPGQKLAAALCMHLEIEFSEGACLEQRTSKSIETKEPKVYPNPVTNTLYVKDVQGRAVEILSIEGTILYSVNNFQAERIDVSTLKNGIYILKVSGVDHVSTFKFIKIE